MQEGFLMTAKELAKALNLSLCSVYRMTGTEFEFGKHACRFGRAIRYDYQAIMRDRGAGEKKKKAVSTKARKYLCGAAGNL